MTPESSPLENPAHTGTGSAGFKRYLRLLGDPYVRIAIALCTLAGIGLIVAAIKLGITKDDLTGWGNQALEFMRSRPFLLFFMICILPAFPVPASPLLILAGVVYTPIVGAPAACAIAIAAMAINLTGTYLVGAYPARNLVRKLIEKYDFKVPTMSGSGAFDILLLLRLTPGFPFFMQNLLLGFLHVPLRLYLPVSITITGAFAIGFVVSGGAIFQGKGALALIGLFVIAIAVALTNILRKKMVKPKPAESANTK